MNVGKETIRSIRVADSSLEKIKNILEADGHDDSSDVWEFVRDIELLISDLKDVKY